jgi:hypothetical protein
MINAYMHMHMQMLTKNDIYTNMHIETLLVNLLVL